MAVYGMISMLWLLSQSVGTGESSGNGPGGVQITPVHKNNWLDEKIVLEISLFLDVVSNVDKMKLMLKYHYYYFYWILGLVIVTSGMYIISVGAVVCYFYFYTKVLYSY